ncbi:hypothetical protein B0H16DRAFT_1465456 [Mycena metata]|uniref:Uncharacterized protein n=1 Tax=Mycena metata TaxID=1033252 RepID=A0AAD7MZP8_9AGAR|nr:hypothetical protein B0H16DRAFT_1465456 [Mycena metata]
MEGGSKEEGSVRIDGYHDRWFGPERPDALMRSRWRKGGVPGHMGSNTEKGDVEMDPSIDKGNVQPGWTVDKGGTKTQFGVDKETTHGRAATCVYRTWIPCAWVFAPSPKDCGNQPKFAQDTRPTTSRGAVVAGISLVLLGFNPLRCQADSFSCPGDRGFFFLPRCMDCLTGILPRQALDCDRELGYEGVEESRDRSLLPGPGVPKRDRAV